MQTKTFNIVLKNAFMLSAKVKHFIFNSQQLPAFDYLPGQFITIHLENGDKILRRSYSIANAPLQDNRIEFATAYVPEGLATKFLFNLKIGDSVNITGPFGRLILKDTVPKRYIMIATSTGITPYRAMLRQMEQKLESYPDLEVVIIQGVQKREDILYCDEFLELSTRYPRLSFRVYLSQETRTDLFPYEHIGHVQQAFPSLKLDPHQDIVYLCGNPCMIDDSFLYLKESNFPIQHIIREKYISN